MPLHLFDRVQVCPIHPDLHAALEPYQPPIRFVRGSELTRLAQQAERAGNIRIRRFGPRGQGREGLPAELNHPIDYGLFRQTVDGWSAICWHSGVVPLQLFWEVRLDAGSPEVYFVPHLVPESGCYVASTPPPSETVLSWVVGHLPEVARKVVLPQPVFRVQFPEGSLVREEGARGSTVFWKFREG